MQGKNPAKPHAFPVDGPLDSYGPKVEHAFLPLLGTESTILT